MAQRRPTPRFRSPFPSLTLSLVLFAAATGVTALLPVNARAEVSQTPLPVSQAVEPMVMFAMSNDHQLFFKAYTDWSDLDGDGAVETTYKHAFAYYGYFDPYKCYAYNADAGYFEPTLITTSKYCSGSDWSGNFLNWASMARVDILRKVLYGGLRSTDSADDTVLERAFIPTDAHSFAKFYEGEDIAQLTPFDGESAITLCNTTYWSGSDSAGESQNASAGPLIRAASGDWRYWAANERWQCVWKEERNKGNQVTTPSREDNGIGLDDYVARVKACVSVGLIGSEDCQRYPSGNYKPVGLLHEYGESDALKFGLMTGSYQKNKSGGVLRKNIGSFTDEVNLDSDGTFKPVAGMVDTLNRLRISRYYYGTGTGDGLYNNTDSCPWGRSSFSDGNCSNWGNPISEIYTEAVRYFAGLDATPAFAADDTSYIAGLTTADWEDPLDSANWCAKSNVILINASEVSYDDQVDTTGLPEAGSAAALTDALGAAEGINGGTYFVGENGTDNDQLCTAKPVTALGSVRGVCPGSPRLGGSYLLSGVAHYAHTTDLRPQLEGEQTLSTRGIALVSGVPKLVIPVPGADSRQVTILPACRNTQPNPDGNCGLVDFKVLDQVSADGVAAGRLYVNWEDTEQGGDFDQDLRGEIRYALDAAANAITVATQIRGMSTSQAMGFGFVINGTTQDGFHAFTGSKGFSYTDSTGVPGCVACEAPVGFGESLEEGDETGTVSHTFVLGESQATLLKDPLWYAAKYGSFDDLDEDGLPDNDHAVYGNAEWDSDDDGAPDGYYQVTNPANLGASVAKVLETVAQLSSSAAVATNSVSLSTGTVIYQARYQSADWSGDVVALPLNSDGSIGEALWNARDELNLQDWNSGRTILTSTGPSAAGAAFSWGSLSQQQQLALRIDPISRNLDSEEEGQARLRYLRGDEREEIEAGGSYRSRDTMLGDIVNSEPAFVAGPGSGYPADFESESYETFAVDHNDRDPMLYVASNDGMLHGFSADDGVERLAYVPRSAYASLPQLTRFDYADNHLFINDGSPVVSDAYFSSDSAWHTVLVAGMAAGGKGVYALDVTDPDAFSEGQAYATVLWDLTVADEGLGDLGYSFARPAIFKSTEDAGGLWVAAVGNGYLSDAGKAVLYILDLEDGEVLNTLVLHPGPGNGLSSVVPVDIDGDRKADYLYAGDLLGNLWRLEPDGQGGWAPSFGPDQPLFTASDKNGVLQSITTRPEVGKHPLGGVQIYFGTGRYFETGDNVPDTSVVNSFYSVWDRLDGSVVDSRSSLLEQEILAELTQSGSLVRITSNYPINWDRSADGGADLGGDPDGEPEPTCTEVVVDGNLADWSVETMLAGSRAMFAGGDPAATPLADAFMNYDADANRVNVAVLARDGASVDATGDNAWVRLLGIGPEPLVDGSSEDFHWVYDAAGNAIGFETSFELADGVYRGGEVQIGLAGDPGAPTTASTGGLRGTRFTLDTDALPPAMVCEEPGDDTGDGEPGDGGAGGGDNLDSGDEETHRGWVIDLVDPVGPTAEGEIQVTDSRLRSDRIIFTTAIPSDAACDFGGTGWVMELAADHGGRLDYPLFDLDGNGTYGSEDLVTFNSAGPDGQEGTDDDVEEDLSPSGIQSEVGIIQKPTIIGAGRKEYKYASGSNEAQIQRISENPGGDAGGRATWIQIQ